MKTGDWIEDFLGNEERADQDAERRVYEYPLLWWIGQAALAFGFGVLIVLRETSLAESPSTRKVLEGALLGLAAVAVVLFRWARGLRRVMLSGDTVTAEYGSGARKSWPIAELRVGKRGDWLAPRLGARVIERRTGRTAFTMYAGMKGWETVAARIGNGPPTG
jgi:hypothetical protein